MHGAAARQAVLFDDLSAGDVGGHEVGRELDSLERRSSTPAIVRTSSVLARPGTPVMIECRRQERQQNLLDDIILPDDDLRISTSSFPRAVDS